jgi:hypothetical protein
VVMVRAVAKARLGGSRVKRALEELLGIGRSRFGLGGEGLGTKVEGAERWVGRGMAGLWGERRRGRRDDVEAYVWTGQRVGYC